MNAIVLEPKQRAFQSFRPIAFEKKVPKNEIGLYT